jgi:hypothetical protein
VPQIDEMLRCGVCARIGVGPDGTALHRLRRLANAILHLDREKLGVADHG